jgi:hypothetical protein
MRMRMKSECWLLRKVQAEEINTTNLSTFLALSFITKRGISLYDSYPFAGDLPTWGTVKMTETKPHLFFLTFYYLISFSTISLNYVCIVGCRYLSALQSSNRCINRNYSTSFAGSWTYPWKLLLQYESSHLLSDFILYNYATNFTPHVSLLPFSLKPININIYILVDGPNVMTQKDI